MSGFKIKELHIEAFGGFNEPVTFIFNTKSAIITGRNGVGKTSLLRAIEFALFGELSFIKGTDFSTTRDEINNAFASSGIAKVVLQLEDDTNNSLTIERRKKIKQKKTTLTSLAYNGKEIVDEKEQALTEFLGLTADEFHHLLYPTQENLQEILNLKPNERSEAIDTILQASKLTTLTEVFKDLAKMFTKKANEQIDTQTATAIEHKQEQLAALDKKILDTEEALAKDNILYADETIISLSRGMHDILPSTTLQYNSLNDLPTFHTAIKKTINGLQKEITEQEQKDREQHNIPILTALKSRFPHIISVSNDLFSTQNELERMHLTVDSLTELITEKESLQAKIVSAQERLDNNNKLVMFLEQAREIITHSEINTCPVCNQIYDKSLVGAQLLNKINEFRQGNQNDLIERKAVLEKDLQKTTETILKLQQIVTKITTLYDQIREELDALETSYANKIVNIISWPQQLQEINNLNVHDSTSNTLGAVKQALVDFSQATTHALDEEMKKITRSQDYATQLAKLGQLEESIQKLVDYHGFRTQKQTITQELQEIEKEVATQQAKKQVYEQIVTEVTQTQNDIVHTQQEFLKNQINTINPTMKQVSSTLSPHPYWSDLNINVGEKRFKGNISNTYEIISNPPNKTGEIVNIKGYFSRGQQNSVILALILGVVQTINKQLNFLLLDDISQSLDTVATKNLAEICTDLALKTQVLVASSDERLIEELEKTIGQKEPASTKIVLAEWNEKGPTCMTSVVSSKPIQV